MSAGEAATQATFWLLDAPDSLITQSHDDADGTGVGYFGPNGAPRVDKEPIAAFEDRRFMSQARDVRSRTYVCHVRHATTGGVTLANTHPFCQHDRLFAHNGVIGDLQLLEEHLGEELDLISGESDSERYFALITREIARHGGDVDAGISAAVDWIVETLPFLSINFVLVIRATYGLCATQKRTHCLCSNVQRAAGERAPRPSSRPVVRARAFCANRPAIIRSP